MVEVCGARSLPSVERENAAVRSTEQWLDFTREAQDEYNSVMGRFPI